MSNKQTAVEIVTALMGSSVCEFMSVGLDSIGRGGVWGVAGHIDGTEEERICALNTWAGFLSTEQIFGDPYRDFRGDWRQKVEVSGVINGTPVRLFGYLSCEVSVKRPVLALAG